MSKSPANWYPDPKERAELRYWDGEKWTDHVSNNGVQGKDPLSGGPVQVTSEADVTATEAGGGAEESAASVTGSHADFVATVQEIEDPELRSIVEHLQLYAAACVDVMDMASAVVEIANRATGARNMANQRPQHEISIESFETMARESEGAFVPVYKSFLEKCRVAKDAAAGARAIPTHYDLELVLLTTVDDNAYGQAGVATHILSTDFGPTVPTFLEGIAVANGKIQADIFGYGDDGFLGHLYSPPAPPAGAERMCPWCAETIKAAAVICRFCNRDIEPASITL